MNLQRRQEFSQTLRGKIYNIVGYTFATYCAARLLMVSSYPIARQFHR